VLQIVKHCENKMHFILLRRLFWHLRISCALTLMLKYKLKTLRQTFRLFGKDLKDPISSERFVDYDLKKSLFAHFK
jgi:hypothetical protein